MRIVIAGGHGKIALLLGELLSSRGDRVVGIIRDPAQAADLETAGMDAAVLDLESGSAADLAAVLEGADAAVFAAGAGPGSGLARKDSVDRAAAALLADACEQAGVSRYVLISSIGVDSVRDGAVPPGLDDVFVAYLQAKLAAEEDLVGRDLSVLAWTVLRPGSLTDDPPTGHVTLAGSVDRGSVPRSDVAAVVVGLLDRPTTAGLVTGVVSGDVPIAQALST